MDIHKPKAAHSWREFLIEIGTIICGILIALGLEQVVEWVHWRHQVEVAEESILPEVRANLLNAYERVSHIRCTSNRIQELRDRLLKDGTDWRAAPSLVVPSNRPLVIGGFNNSIGATFAASPMPMVVQSSGASWTQGSWSAAVASGVPLHMKPERVRVYLTLYQGFKALQDLRDQEKQDGAALSPLGFDRSLGPGERGHYLELLGRVNYSNTMIAYISTGMLGQAAAAGLRIRKSDFDRRLASWKTVPQLKGCADLQPAPLDAK